MPAFPVPMQDERLARDLAALDDFHAGSPDILCGGGGDRAQDVVLDLRLPHTRAGNHAPAGAIPVLRQGPPGSSLVSILKIVAHRPHVLCGNGRHRKQLVGVQTHIGTGNDTPGTAVPMLDQGVIGNTAAVKGVAHCPDIAG